MIGGSIWKCGMAAGVVGLLLLGACSSTTPTVTGTAVATHGLAARPAASPAVTIANDPGGTIIDYAVRVKNRERTGTAVRFAGRCDSACTLHLGLPRSKTCIMPGASFGFHLPYGSSPRANREAAAYLMKSYPEWVRAWIRSKGGLGHQVKTMDYAYASTHLRACSRAA